jgi:hypothetical protein
VLYRRRTTITAADNRSGRTAEVSEPSQGQFSEQSGQVSCQPGIVRG